VIAEGVSIYLEDNTLAWTMGDDGTYTPVAPAESKALNSQERLLQLLAGATAA
jgi:hypothetical protein